MKVNFFDLDREIQTKRCTLPQAVFVTLNPDDETTEQVIERQEKFLSLPEDVKEKLISHETAEKIKAIGAHYNLELLQMAPIARVIRSYYFGEAKIEDFAEIIEKESKIPKEEAQNIARYIKDRIISREIKEIDTVKLEKMLFNEAVEAFPEIKNQKITEYSIESEGQMFAPTVANWIQDYYNLVGAGSKDIMKISSYLYHSKNGKKLSSSDRHNLAQLIRAVDQNIPLNIDTQKREIVFDLSSETPKVKTPLTPPIAPKNINGVISRPVVEIARKNNFDVKKATVEKAEESRDLHTSFGVNSENNRNDINNEKTTIRHIHGNSWNLGSAHFREDVQTKKSGWNFLKGAGSREQIKKGAGLEGVDNLKFSSAQILSSEKVKEDEMVPHLRDEPTKRTSINPKNDFFGRIRPME